MSHFSLKPDNQDFCIHELFQSQVERLLNPDVVAIVFEDQQLTYRELNCRANQLAQHLQSLGVGPEVLVGIYLERSLEMVVGLLGILKAGGAYVPLDPGLPLDRLTFMLEDAQVQMVLTQEHLAKSLTECQTCIICLDRDWEVIAQQNKENPISEVTPDHLAYTIYTSGSTGKPKGVQIPHRAAVNFLNSMRLSPGITEQDRLLAVTTITFDIAALEVFLPLIVGACVVIVSREVASDGVQLSNALLASGATVMQATPATWKLLLKAGWEGSKQLKILCGGEALPQKLANQLLKNCASLWNLYGPTETTIWSTICQVDFGNSSMCIGRPIANTQVYILNAQMETVPIGVPGEVYIGGAGLARGYLNRPDLTTERFIPNPFSDEPDVRLYKTGDLARYLSDGNIEYIGRIDYQVKIRGFRIELGEIETVLWQHPAVENAVVIAREDIPGDKRLVAYIVSKLPRSLFGDLRNFLKQKLPDYMIPSSFVFLNALPLTPNGKIDRQALPVPDNIRPELEEDFVAPCTPVEEVLAEIWAVVLGLKQIGIYDNFLELGGHSLLATQIISRVRDTYQVELPVRELFDRPTIAGLAKSIETMLSENQNLQVSPIQPTSRNFTRANNYTSRNLPLSFAQERLWFLDQLVPENPFYNVTEAVRLTGALNIAALEQSFKEIIRRHETLRTIYATVDGQPVQVIDDSAHFQISVVNLQELPKIEREVQAQQLATQEAQQLFDLSQGPLLRVTLLQLDDQESILLLNLHHILCDDWSFGVLFKELTALYEAFSTGKLSPLPELAVQYADFAVWQRQWLQKKVLDQQLAYWQQQLANLPILQLPTDRPRPLVPTYRGALQPLVLPQSLTAALKALSQQEGVTLFMTLLAAFQTLLFRYTNSEDIPVGTAIANRHQPNVEGLIGFFVNTVVLRTDVSGSPSFKELLVRVREVALAAYTYQDLPFEKVVAQLQPERYLSRQPLFQVVFALQNIAPSASLQLSGLKTTSMTIDNKTAKFDLFLQLSDTPNGLTGWFEYSTDLFDAATISRMAGHFQTLLEGIVANPEQCLLNLPLLTERERYQLLVEWNDQKVDYPLDTCVHQLFEVQVQENPDAVAVVFEKQHLTYGELNCRANQLAHHLKTLGVEPEEVVGICVDRSLEMMIGILGIMKAGGAYLPLDPAYPPERLTFMLEDANVQVLLTQEQWVERLQSHPSQIICLDKNWETLAQENEDNLNSNLTTKNLAYVIYTSGSTGKPKGVRIEHRGLLNLVFWHQRRFAISPLDRVTQIAGVAFDACVWEIWPYLTAGASIHIPNAETRRLPEQLRDWLVSTAITISFLPTPIAEQVLLLEWPDNTALRILLTGGDKLHQYPLTSHPFQVVNNYGPTENTVVTTSGLVSCEEQAELLPTIGRPIANTQVYILDRHLQPVPIGVSGEMYISGVGLARDYLNQPNLTSERFIPNHFSDEPGTRLYKTGDLARYLSDGNIEFLGRIDQQVKLRGFRIELNEIEVVLRQHPAVQMAAIAFREDVPGQKRLVAYVVQNPQSERTPETLASQSASLAQHLILEMRRFLQEKLPDYMVPSAFVLLDALPLNPNGKLDRSALPAPQIGSSRQEEDFVAYRTPVEEQIVNLWTKVLGIENIGIKENFFELGGNSLLAAQLIAYVRETFSVELPVRCIFEQPTVEGLAEIIQTLHQKGISAITTAIDFNAEAILAPEIFPQGTPIDDISEPRHIFLTGATGFVGAFLLHELLEQTQAKIYCLVRSLNESEGAKRLQRTLEKYLLWNPNQSSRIIPIAGDLDKPLLGLSAEQFERLTYQIDTIYHSGAQVNFAKPYSTIKAANVGGTQEVLRLACTSKVKPVHYISTCGIYGATSYFTGIKVIKEEDDIHIAEDYLCMDIGYVQSKWVAEKIVHIAKSRKLPVSIYRLGLVMGDTRIGVGNTADYVSRMIKGCIQLGSYPDLVDQKQELVSVDYVTKAIVHLSNQKESLGKTFHLVPLPSQNIDLIQFFDLISSLGYQLKKIPYTQWKNELMEQTQKSQENALYPLVPMIVEKVYQDSLTIVQLYQNTPEFDCKNTLDGLAGTSIVCPSMDEKLLRTYFSYFISSGFLELPK